MSSMLTRLGMAYRQSTIGHSLPSRGKLDCVNSVLLTLSERYEEPQLHHMC